MLEGIIFLASYGAFDGGTIGNLLSDWEQMGFFSYLLPFLLIFALVFGVLSHSQIFKDNNAINSVIALAVSFMALQFDLVPVFFAEIFPRLGVGLAIILVALIMLGLFASKKQVGILFWTAAIIFIAILINTSGALGWSSGNFWDENWSTIFLVAVFIGLVIWAISSVTSKKKVVAGGEGAFEDSPLGRALSPSH